MTNAGRKFGPHIDHESAAKKCRVDRNHGPHMSMNTSEVLNAKRAAFNAYHLNVIQPMLGLTSEKMDDLGFVETAKRIDDLSVLRRYCELAIELLDANIAHCRPDATTMPLPERSNLAVIVSTLLAAALAHYLGGVTVALVCAAAWYWLAADTAKRRARQDVRIAQEHNELVPEWGKAVQDWESERDELRALCRLTPR